MVSGVRSEGAISARVQKTIQSIREIVGNHSEADIYAVLKETNMDPNETTQKLLNQDPFHEVKRKKDKRRESSQPRAMGCNNSTEARKHSENITPIVKSYSSWDQNGRKNAYTRNSLPGAGISKEFRVVRDNRLNQIVIKDHNSEPVQHPVSRNEKVTSNPAEKSSTGIMIDRKHSSGRNSQGQMRGNGPNDINPCPSKNTESKFTKEVEPAASLSPSKSQGEAYQSSQPFKTLISTNSVGMYSSSTDPIHVPSADSRSPRIVGAIRREVGVVGVQRQSSNRAASQQAVDASPHTESFRQPTVIPRSNQVNQPQSVDANTSIAVNRPHFNIRQHPQPVNHQKVVLSNKEWKPKSIQKTPIDNSIAVGSSSADSSRGSQLDDISGLSQNLSEVNISENLHVIIPQHLRVPEAERAGLMFGSFGAVPDSSETLLIGSAEESHEEPSASVSASVPVGSNEESSTVQQDELLDYSAMEPQSDSPESSMELEQQTDVICDSASGNIESYTDIGLVRNPPYPSAESQQLETPNLPTFPSYGTQEEAAFFKTTMEENLHGQSFSSQQEVLNSHMSNSCPLSAGTIVHQQPPPPQQQQQPLAQLYPHLHLSPFPNFVPYRHPLFSPPLYMTQMTVPNYSNNPAYPPHPSSGSSYLLMPGGTSHLNSAGMKYAASQYKPVPANSAAAYGNYNNPNGFAIGPIGSVNATSSHEDVSRMKYKDNNLYVPNQQGDAPDIWVQTPREMPNVQSPSFYNLPGQVPHPTFIPTHAGHVPPFNAAPQSSHVQYPSMYHPPQPPTIANPHQLVHQQVPAGLGGNVGVGIPAPTTQVGTYPQPQIGVLNWTPANF